ncbi:hypothetical protein ACLOJK_006948, partial [Asimina triloba]
DALEMVFADLLLTHLAAGFSDIYIVCYLHEWDSAATIAVKSGFLDWMLVVERVGRCLDLLDRWMLEKTMDQTTNPCCHLLEMAGWWSRGDRPALDAADLRSLLLVIGGPLDVGSDALLLAVRG